MNKNLAFDLARVTEVTAMAAYKWIGFGDKNKADNAAVLAMREMLNDLPISGEIVIGEGEIDDAPMLFIGEKVGLRQEDRRRHHLQQENIHAHQCVQSCQ